ncbi:hypothetical protein [Salinihabitans flavidus]|uniref:hypothetical protein n=1 Tax=Salinihabitans flavidus TaxID=569882 RepID=UPI001587290F|nr:hypothetical protein [Salinihabitans flavidus]
MTDLDHWKVSRARLILLWFSWITRYFNVSGKFSRFVVGRYIRLTDLIICLEGIPRIIKS